MVTLESELQLHPQVALRPEPFGALAYHYGNRRLVFLRHPDMVRVVRSLDGSQPLGVVLAACDVAPPRWDSFVRALAQLERSEIVVPTDAPHGVLDGVPTDEPPGGPGAADPAR